MDFMEGPDFNPYGFFEYLKICKGYKGVQLLSEINTNNLNSIKSNDHYRIITFKTYICELVYNAVNLFPDISSYTIICKNTSFTSTLTFTLYDELSDDNKQCMAKFEYKDVGVYYLTLNDIKNFYMHNRYHEIDTRVINHITAIMQMDGSVPKITTEYITNQSPKLRLKFK